MAEDYRVALGSVHGLRRGITTGTCAAAAARAAALLLCRGERSPRVVIRLPESRKPYSGALISVPVARCEAEGNAVIAAVVKDAGDDDDATNGLLITATVREIPQPGVRIRGGKGVGIVTRAGLPVRVGVAAINPAPRAMIREALEGLCGPDAGLDVLVEAPDGEAVAPRTWNPRIGVAGGISIIGTSGVVEPKSSAAFRTTILRSVRACAANGVRRPVVTPGYVGERFLRSVGVPDVEVVTVGDHVGLALRACAVRHCEGVILVGHVGKLVKVAAGLFNTHSRWGDARLETLAAHAAAAGAPSDLVGEILSMRLAEGAASLLLERGYGRVFSRIARRVSERSTEQCGIPVACTLLSIEGEELASMPADLWKGAGR